MAAWLLPLAMTVGATVWLVRSRWLALRLLGWALAVMVTLFGGLIVLTQGSINSVPIGTDDLWDGWHQNNKTVPRN